MSQAIKSADGQACQLLNILWLMVMMLVGASAITLNQRLSPSGTMRSTAKTCLNGNQHNLP
ncbi:hypothetical protein ACFOD0_02700 [Shewanella intestini]|uniref:Uncharacterized protein n=1 Tax=Shewanella intestini TaxID=2017544 RepID=A0ABS5I6E0_9GAMM|nr:MULTISPECIES: hypothetical protein [Shewanella]MBR9729579.1 hypothetical protein [Shewanella intestini]MRG37649.1 hypothetical protein [Shewanella sp. XMDDZSB0408]